MSANVVSLHQHKQTSKTKTLEVLDKVREMIETGEIEQFMAVITLPGGNFGTVYCREEVNMALIGAMEVAKLELMDAYISESAPDE